MWCLTPIILFGEIFLFMGRILHASYEGLYMQVFGKKKIRTCSSVQKYMAFEARKNTYFLR